MSEESTGFSADLSGQVAIVTGASQGLGKAMAIELGRRGAKIACVARNAEKLTETVNEITTRRIVPSGSLYKVGVAVSVLKSVTGGPEICSQ